MNKVSLLSVLMVFTGALYAAEAQQEPLTLTMFYGKGCPSCEKMEAFLKEKIDGKYPHLTIVRLETWNDTENAAKFEEMAKEYGHEAGGVPMIFFSGASDRVFVGYTPDIAKAIEDIIQGK